jgi:LysM repeat protein
MRNFFSIFFCLSVVSISLFGQTKGYVKHTVSSGETIAIIAQKYQVTPFDIYQLNPDSQKGIALNSILLIPSGTTIAISKTAMGGKHTVATKETWFSISKLYGVTIVDLEKANPALVDSGLKIGQEITIPNQITTKNSLGEFQHTVLPKETKYSIATQYSISVEDINRLNPTLGESLPIGYSLVIRESNSSTKINESVNNTNVKVNSKVPSSPVIKKNSLTTPALVQSKQEKKQLALLLPFNISKLESDTINSLISKLKKDKFLNMTLDFYAGALMAIDSAKTLGISIDVTVIDSQETKNSAAVESLISKHSLQNKDAIIGPFYQTNVEKTAEILNKFKVPVISPLSKESGKQFSNLYQSMPSTSQIRTAVFDYMKEKQGSIVAIIDSKKESTKQYLKANQKSVKIVGLTPKGTFVIDSLKKVLVKDKMNFVIMDTQKTGLIFAITNAMISLLPQYQLQLVILEQNPTLDFEEVALERLTKLKMLYPSITRENTSPEAVVFETAFKKKNKIFPSQFATRGFDITFDTLLRLSQDSTFEESIQTTKSEQIENKFDYVSAAEGYQNNGVYILYYDTDLFTKEAK